MSKDANRDDGGKVTPATLRATVAAFETLSDADLNVLLDHGEVRHFESSAAIFHEGMPARAFYFLLSGTVQIRRQLTNGATMDVATFGPGSIFGEVALLAGTERTASSYAEGKVTVLRVPGEKLWVDYRDGKSYAQIIMLAVAKLLASRLEAMNRRMSDTLVQQHAGSELAAFRRKMFQDWTI
ncbi:MAG: hypothetical protein HMLKMBBP_02755 [Planctomycetes bacterium]|nr:hypothetical protein [Planctomycetota bacterium]